MLRVLFKKVGKRVDLLISKKNTTFAYEINKLKDSSFA